MAVCGEGLGRLSHGPSPIQNRAGSSRRLADEPGPTIIAHAASAEPRRPHGRPSNRVGAPRDAMGGRPEAHDDRQCLNDCHPATISRGHCGDAAVVEVIAVTRFPPQAFRNCSETATQPNNISTSISEAS
jgi:hypothetical protein